MPVAGLGTKRSSSIWRESESADSPRGCAACLMAEHLTATARFYELLGRLQMRIGGAPTLADCHGRMNWPTHGVYFFFEAGELRRSRSGEGLRVVRVGTHTLKSGSRRTLWNRLSEHRGPASRLGGDHRASIFRELLGLALACQENIPLPRNHGASAGAAERPRADWP